MKIDILKIRDGTGPAPNDDAVAQLAESIDRIDMHAPIAVLANGDTYLLQAGRTRLAACRKLGRKQIEAEVFTDAHEAKLWTIAENLHRKDLSKMERAKLNVEWLEEVAKEVGHVLSQVATKRARSHKSQGVGKGAGGGRKQSGARGAARKVNISKDQAVRSQKIAGLSEAAQAVARDLGLENNQRALLAAAAQPTPDGEVASLKRDAEIMAKRQEKRRAARRVRHRRSVLVARIRRRQRSCDHGSTRNIQASSSRSVDGCRPLTSAKCGRCLLSIARRFRVIRSNRWSRWATAFTDADHTQSRRARCLPCRAYAGI